jgi:hypothetical protein
MNAQIDLLHEIETLTPAQRESVYSFVYLLKNPQYLQVSFGKAKVEPFENEKDAAEFANHYSKRILRETR